MYNLDEVIDRQGTASNKWEGRGLPKEYQGKTLCFTVADMDFATPPCIVNALNERNAHPLFGYTHPTADLNKTFIAWQQERHNLSVDPKDIKATSGILTGMAMAIRAICQPGDKVLAYTPVYNPFFTIIEGAGCELVECPLINDDNSYQIDFTQTEKYFKEGVKAVLFCNPHNPVGRVWQKDELTKLAELCLKYHVYLLSDEAHADFALFDHEYTSVYALESIRDISVTCISPNKTFNIAGISIAYLLCHNQDILKKINDLLRGVWITTPSIYGMVAATAGYSQGGEWLDEVKSYLEENSRYVTAFFKDVPEIEVTKHEGTYLMWLRVSKTGSSTIIKNRLLEKGILLGDGKEYRGDGQDYLRFNIAAPKSLIIKACEGLKEVVTDFRNCGLR
ncbi:MAG: PatB family C-S lyase [Erysipelotrichaceae bacterium]|nr:PatB family C-S lyase [Erysipelotrichaceae bacterium]